jgi:hypothetical protein
VPPGESGGSVSAVTFAQSAGAQGMTMTVEFYDQEGLGKFTRG